MPHLEKSSELFSVAIVHGTIISNNAGQNHNHKLSKMLSLHDDSGSYRPNLLEHFCWACSARSLCTSDLNVDEFPWERFCFFHHRSSPPEISKEHTCDCGARRAWHVILADVWCRIPDTVVNIYQSFCVTRSMAPWNLFLSAIWDQDSSAASRHISVLDIPNTGLVWWLRCQSTTDFTCLITDCPWLSYPHHTSLFFFFPV